MQKVISGKTVLPEDKSGLFILGKKESSLYNTCGCHVFNILNSLNRANPYYLGKTILSEYHWRRDHYDYLSFIHRLSLFPSEKENILHEAIKSWRVYRSLFKLQPIWLG